MSDQLNTPDYEPVYYDGRYHHPDCDTLKTGQIGSAEYGRGDAPCSCHLIGGWTSAWTPPVGAIGRAIKWSNARRPTKRVPVFEEPVKQMALIRTRTDLTRSDRDVLWIRLGHRWVEIGNPRNEVIWPDLAATVVEIVFGGQPS